MEKLHIRLINANLQGRQKIEQNPQTKNDEHQRMKLSVYLLHHWRSQENYNNSSQEIKAYNYFQHLKQLLNSVISSIRSKTPAEHQKSYLMTINEIVRAENLNHNPQGNFLRTLSFLANLIGQISSSCLQGWSLKPNEACIKGKQMKASRMKD